jgi:hypothetical protein
MMWIVKRAQLNFLQPTLRTFDLLLAVSVVPAAILLLLFRKIGSRKLPRTSQRLKNLGIFPIVDHYYEPLFNERHLLLPLEGERDLPGIKLNPEQQLAFLSTLGYAGELESLEFNTTLVNPLDFHINNGSFESGDADFLYQFIRTVKPRKIIEIGCGESTKIIQLALKRNKAEDLYQAIHICIEPYEQPWLKEFPHIDLIRKRVEAHDLDWTQELEDGDLLFIDSSHIIRPQGDVVTEYLQILPKLSKGVYVQVHDIFTPRDYPKQWIVDDVRFWNEQYLFEALLSNTDRYRIVAALNYLKHEHYSELQRVCPYITANREPGSFYIQIC